VARSDLRATLLFDWRRDSDLKITFTNGKVTNVE